MKNYIGRIISIFPILVLIAGMGCGPSKEDKKLMNLSNNTFGILHDKMPGSEIDTPERINLGKRLFFEKKLSINDSQSCNSCHMVEGNKGGVDNLPTSPGAHKKNGSRNSPTVLNAGFHVAQFWDGRAKSLEEQAKGPILNPVEMAMPSESAVMTKLKKIPAYQEDFKKAFPKAKNPMTYDNLAKAIASFERTLITRDSFDDFQKGDADAISPEAKEGIKTFIKSGCAVCHGGRLLGGRTFQKMGLVQEYKNSKDLGRFNVTKKKADKFFFKVPSLRNIAITAPYFHDGNIKKLKDVIRIMALIQLNKKLTDKEVDSIQAFLKTLTDKKKI